MTFKQVMITYETLPAWAQAEVTSYLGKNKGNCPVYLQLCDDGLAHVGGVGDEYSRRRVVGRAANGTSGALDSMYYDSLTVATSEEKQAYFGGPATLGMGDAILTIVAGYKTNPVTMYIHAQGTYAPLAHTVPTGEELSPLQMAVIHLYCGLTTAGRKHEIASRRIPMGLVNQVTDELVNMQLFKRNKNGAIRKSKEAQQLHSNTRTTTTDWHALISEWRNTNE